MRLTKSELEIMEVLWAADEPLCRADIIAVPRTKPGKQLCPHPAEQHAEEEAIQEAGFVRGARDTVASFTPASF